VFGQPDRPLCFHDDAEYRFWSHIRNSAKHQAILQARARDTVQLLERLPQVMADARAHQKLMRNPALAPLRRLFR
jgi:hypothetical protein